MLQMRGHLTASNTPHAAPQAHTAMRIAMQVEQGGGSRAQWQRQGGGGGAPPGAAAAHQAGSKRPQPDRWVGGSGCLGMGVWLGDWQGSLSCLLMLGSSAHAMPEACHTALLSSLCLCRRGAARGACRAAARPGSGGTGGRLSGRRGWRGIPGGTPAGVLKACSVQPAATSRPLNAPLHETTAAGGGAGGPHWPDALHTRAPVRLRGCARLGCPASCAPDLHRWHSAVCCVLVPASASPASTPTACLPPRFVIERTIEENVHRLSQQRAAAMDLSAASGGEQGAGSTGGACPDPAGPCCCGG